MQISSRTFCFAGSAYIVNMKVQSICIKYFISLFFLLRLQLTANPLNKITNMKTKLVPNIRDGFRANSLRRNDVLFRICYLADSQDGFRYCRSNLGSDSVNILTY